MRLQATLLFGLFLSLLLEATIFSLPIFLATAIIIFVLFPSARNILLIFLGAVFLDVLTFRYLGSTALIVFFIFALINLYWNVFNIKDYKIIALYIVFFSYLYAYIFSSSKNLILYLVLYIMLMVTFRYFYNKKLLW